MGVFEIIGGVLLIVCGVILILLIMPQQPRGGMGTVGGGDMFSDMRTRSADARAAKVTKYVGIAFFVLAVAVGAINIFIK